MENEAKKSLEFLISGKSDQYPPDYDLQIQVAIKALEEVEKYRNIGVVSADELEQDLLLYKADREILSEYQKLGTVEELKIAKEKQIPKKPNDKIKTIPELDENGAYIDADISVILLCPICGNQVGIDDCIDNYCSYCGQKLDRSDSD